MDRTSSSPRPTEGAARIYALRLAGGSSSEGRGCPDRPRSEGPGSGCAADGDPEPVASLPAGTGAGAADRENPLRIDAYAAISASLDPATRQVFDEAVATLRALKRGREQVEAKLTETGRQDPIRTVTGTSALDAAIERTEAIIRSLSELRGLADAAERV